MEVGDTRHDPQSVFCERNKSRDLWNVKRHVSNVERVVCKMCLFEESDCIYHTAGSFTRIFERNV